MPCYDSRSHEERTVTVDRQSTLDKVEMLEAALCVSMKAHEQLMEDLTDSGAIENADLYAIFDFKEAGISETQLKNWWANHKMEDELRKVREEKAEKARIAKQVKAIRQRELLKSAKSKLTDEELAAIGIKS